MKYNVHVFTTVRVKVENIEANSIKEACQYAENNVDYTAIFDNELKSWTGAKETEWAEETPSASPSTLYPKIPVK